jgi:hypothetical protein
MKALLLASALATLVPGAGVTFAADPSVPPALRDGGACFEQARVFDRTLQAVVPSLEQASERPSSRIEEATQTRNRGITACLEGRVQEGVQRLEQAVIILRS